MSIPVYRDVNFDAIIEAYAKNNALFLPALVYFDFLSEPIATWGGHYDLTIGRVTWQGLGRSGLVSSIEGIEASSTTQSSDMTFTMSGVDSTVLSIFGGTYREEYVGRLVAVYGLFCTEDWQPVPGSRPFAYAVGIMGTASVSRVPSQGSDGESSWTRSISLPASNIFYGRNGIKNSYFTDRDQQRRHPGDKFFTFVQSIQETSIPQPWR